MASSKRASRLEDWLTSRSSKDVMGTITSSSADLTGAYGGLLAGGRSLKGDFSGG
jgi:hypothetical protein